MKNKNGVIVFLRAPEIGRVKTRLAADLDRGFVLKLYKALVEDTLESIRGHGDSFIFFFPPDKKDMVQSWLGGGYIFCAQSGGDIGRKMADAFERIFNRGYEHLLLVGTDIPGLTGSVIQESFDLLAVHKTVLGPSEDGGYYLIGFQKKSFCADVFCGIDWSTSRVFSQTLDKMKIRNIFPAIIQKRNDIDTAEDFAQLVKDRSATGQNLRSILHSFS